MADLRREVVFCPYQGVGHVTPAIIFAEKLSRLGVPSRIIIGGRQLYNGVIKNRQNGQSDPNIVLEVIEVDEPNERSPDSRQRSNGVRNLEMDETIGQPLDNRVEGLCQRLSQLANSDSPPVCVLLDFCILTSGKFSGWATDLLSKLSFCLFSPLSAVSLVLMTNNLVEGLVKFNQEKMALDIPNLPPIQLHDFQDIKEMHDMGHNMSTQMKLFDTIVFNTCEELEPGPLATLRDYFSSYFGKNVFSVGPLLADTYFQDQNGKFGITRSFFDKGDDQSLYKTWLDLQPQASVLFICFGSWIQISEEQIQELAFGLESSKHRFLWVIPSEEQAAVLPEGFKSRIRERGLVTVGWAPQQMILGHESTGAFLSVCGWNSVMETVCLGGIPILCWPVFGDQLVNCRYVVDGLGMGVEVIGNKEEKGLVRRDEVTKAVKEVMEKEGLRKRAGELKAAVRNSGRESKGFHAFAGDRDLVCSRC